MQLSTGPDIRWEVHLADGTKVLGSRKKVLDSAVMAWDERGVAVWKRIAPGLTEKTKEQRRQLIQKDYEKRISSSESHKP